MRFVSCDGCDRPGRPYQTGWKIHMHIRKRAVQSAAACHNVWPSRRSSGIDAEEVPA